MGCVNCPIYTAHAKQLIEDHRREEDERKRRFQSSESGQQML